MARVLGEARAAQVVVLVADGPVGIGIPLARHAAQGVVGVGGPGAPRHGAGSEPVQGVVGKGRFVVAGGCAGTRRIGDGMDHAPVGVMDTGGSDALFVVHGPVGAAQAGSVSPVAVAGIDCRVFIMARGDDAGDPEERIVVIGGLCFAVLRGGDAQGAVVSEALHDALLCNGCRKEVC